MNITSQSDYGVDLHLEKQRFLVSEKKMQMIQLQAKLDALGSFNSNFIDLKILNVLAYCLEVFIRNKKVSLKELDDYNAAAKFAARNHEFRTELHQNLELWDNLMRVYNQLDMYLKNKYTISC